MYISYRQGLQRNSKGTDISQFGSQGLYRLSVAIGVTFTVILIIVYLNTLSLSFIGIQSAAASSIIEMQKNFLTIVGTAFASLIAFYFGTRGTQGILKGRQQEQA
jgi:hypothetical protein